MTAAKTNLFIFNLENVEEALVDSLMPDILVEITFLQAKLCLKFNFSEKATKMCAIVLTVLKFTQFSQVPNKQVGLIIWQLRVNVKTIRMIANICVAFSEKLNINVLKGFMIVSNMADQCKTWKNCGHSIV